jgi:hypothetical protein
MGKSFNSEQIPTFVNLPCHNDFINGFYQEYTLDFIHLFMHINLVLFKALSLTLQELQNLKDMATITVTLTTLFIQYYAFLLYDMLLYCCKMLLISSS